jgi:acetyl-CoA decarbonylase/synthase complex subunit gamma
MALSGLDIYKLLPKTNCKKCGFQTCLAFAMQLAKKAVALEKCPFVTPEVRAVLEEASQPAIRLVEVGCGPSKVSVGNETVLFRHEEKFHHPTAIGFIIEDSLCDDDIRRACEEIHALKYERVGQEIGVEFVALRQVSGDPARFASCVELIKKITTQALVLMPQTQEALAATLKISASDRPLVYCSDMAEAEAFGVFLK